MSTEAKEVKVNRNAVSAIASAIAAGLKQVGATGSLLHSCVTIAKQHYKGKAIPKVDIDATLEALVESQGWKGRTIDIRKSEYRSVLNQYATLPEAMAEFKAKSGRCSWMDGIALSRLLRNKAPKAAAAAHATRKAPSKTDYAQMTRANAKAEFAKYAKRAAKMVKLEKDFRDALRELCKQYEINV